MGNKTNQTSAWNAEIEAAQTAPVNVPEGLLELLRKAGQVISWQCFGECRAFSEGRIPEPSEVVEQIKAILSAAPSAPAQKGD